MEDGQSLFFEKAMEEPFYSPAAVSSVFFDEDANETFVEVTDKHGRVLKTEISRDCILEVGTPVMIKKAGVAVHSTESALDPSKANIPTYTIHYEIAGDSVFLVASSDSKDWGANLVDPIITRTGKPRLELIDVRQKGNPEKSGPRNFVIKSHLMALSSDVCRDCPVFRLCGPANVGQFEIDQDQN